MARSSSRVFSRKLSPNAALLAASTQLHLGDPSFVPDTLQVAKSLPAKSGQYDEDDSVPDTPELSPENVSPVIARSRGLSGRKMALDWSPVDRREKTPEPENPNYDSQCQSISLLSNLEDEDIKIVDCVSRPKFAHVGPTVRGKEERKKLLGFDCPECQEYYQQKLEEGLTKDQILMLMNKCSKHRGLFKPPLTPERFWDADIIEDDPDDPRVKTQPGKPLRTRAVRRAEVRERKRALDLEKAA